MDGMYKKMAMAIAKQIHMARWPGSDCAGTCPFSLQLASTLEETLVAVAAIERERIAAVVEKFYHPECSAACRHSLAEAIRARGKEE